MAPTCTAGRASASRAPKWMIMVALVVLLLLTLTLAFQYLVRPVASIISGRPSGAPPLPANMYSVGGLSPSPFDPLERFEVQAPPVQGTLVFLRMDGCGWCERFKPTWTQMVKQDGPSLRSHRGVLMADYEAGNPAAAKYSKYVQGYPTLLFAPTTSREAVAVYEGPRTRDSLLAFVDIHTSRYEGFDQAPPTPRVASGADIIARGAMKTIKDSKPATPTAPPTSVAQPKAGG